jgi:hypothetical protein
MTEKSRGYIVIAQNTKFVNYLEQAYALALNLKLTQSQVNRLAVCVDESTMRQITDKHKAVFDHVILIPWRDDAADTDWKINNKWKYLYMTPYDETVVLDTDMLFPTDVSHWWDIMTERDVWFTTNVRTYRDEVVTSDFYRTYFRANNLPNVYTAFFYFKKSDLASELFAMAEIVFQHWQRFFHKYMPEGKPAYLSGDVAFALATQLLGIEHLCTKDSVQSMPTFVHMKSHVQNVKDFKMAPEWTGSLPTYYNSYRDFKIGNFQQTLPFHYTDKSWLTADMIHQLEQDYFYE